MLPEGSHWEVLKEDTRLLHTSTCQTNLVREAANCNRGRMLSVLFKTVFQGEMRTGQCSQKALGVGFAESLVILRNRVARCPVLNWTAWYFSF